MDLTYSDEKARHLLSAPLPLYPIDDAVPDQYIRLTETTTEKQLIESLHPLLAKIHNTIWIVGHDKCFTSEIKDILESFGFRFYFLDPITLDRRHCFVCTDLTKSQCPKLPLPVLSSLVVLPFRGFGFSDMEVLLEKREEILTPFEDNISSHDYSLECGIKRLLHEQHIPIQNMKTPFLLHQYVTKPPTLKTVWGIEDTDRNTAPENGCWVSVSTVINNREALNLDSIVFHQIIRLLRAQYQRTILHCLEDDIQIEIKKDPSRSPGSNLPDVKKLLSEWKGFMLNFSKSLKTT